MRFAVQELFGPAALADRSAQAFQRAGEEGPVRVGQLRRPVVVGNKHLGVRNPVREVRGGHVDLAHSGLHAFERVIGGSRPLHDLQRFTLARLDCTPTAGMVDGP
jgi:hypothetical protein